MGYEILPLRFAQGFGSRAQDDKWEAQDDTKAGSGWLE
jgi:hypothetical protein